MTPSGYVVAGFETLSDIIKNFMNNTKGRFDDNFVKEDIGRIMAGTCSGFLHSYGQNFHNKKNYIKYDKAERKVYEECRATGFFDNSDFIVDSGGYQISVGRLSFRESNLLLTMYYEWLENNHDLIDKAFILDVPPGPSCEIFNDFDQLMQLNLDSYLRAKDLDPVIRDKIIYIHHFRTPELWDLYLKILRDYDMFDSFKHHGTGGIVANMASDMSIPIVIYILPIIPLLNDCIRAGRDYLDFHILGGSNFRDIFFYELFKVHVQNTHNISLNITYDSSGLYKAIMVARYVYIFDGYDFVKVSIKNFNLDKRFKGGKKIIDAFREYTTALANRWGLKPIAIEEMYDKGGKGTFYEEVKIYTFLCLLDQYQQVQEKMITEAARVYPLYNEGNISEFTQEILTITRSLNSGKTTKKQKVKSESMVTSLDMLASLDEDHCKYIVDQHLSKDEFIDLIPDQKLMTI